MMQLLYIKQVRVVVKILLLFSISMNCLSVRVAVPVFGYSDWLCGGDSELVRLPHPGRSGVFAVDDCSHVPHHVGIGKTKHPIPFPAPTPTSAEAARWRQPLQPKPKPKLRNDASERSDPARRATL